MGEHLNEFGNSEVYIVGDDGGYKELGKIKDVEIETTGSEDLYPDLKIPESSEFSCSVRICKPLKLTFLCLAKEEALPCIFVIQLKGGLENENL